MLTVVSWDTDRQVAVCLVALTKPFRSGNAPLNVPRFLEFCCGALAALFCNTCRPIRG